MFFATVYSYFIVLINFGGLKLQARICLLSVPCVSMVREETETNYFTHQCLHGWYKKCYIRMDVTLPQEYYREKRTSGNLHPMISATATSLDISGGSRMDDVPDLDFDFESNISK